MADDSQACVLVEGVGGGNWTVCEIHPDGSRSECFEYHGGGVFMPREDADFLAFEYAVSQGLQVKVKD